MSFIGSKSTMAYARDFSYKSRNNFKIVVKQIYACDVCYTISPTLQNYFLL